MSVKKVWLLSLPILLLILIGFNSVVYAVEERKVFSRNYVGIELEVYTPYQCYGGENITVRARVESLEDVKNVSATIFIWGSKSEGHDPWGTSFTVLEVTDFPSGTVKEEAYNVTIPSDIDLGLTYGILLLDWSIYRSASWEDQWDKASFRATYVKNKDYEDLQDEYNEVLNELRNIRTLMCLFLATTIALTFSTAYFAKWKPRAKRN